MCCNHVQIVHLLSTSTLSSTKTLFDAQRGKWVNHRLQRTNTRQTAVWINHMTALSKWVIYNNIQKGWLCTKLMSLTEDEAHSAQRQKLVVLNKIRRFLKHRRIETLVTVMTNTTQGQTCHRIFHFLLWISILSFCHNHPKVDLNAWLTQRQVGTCDLQQSVSNDLNLEQNKPPCKMLLVSFSF